MAPAIPGKSRKGEIEECLKILEPVRAMQKQRLYSLLA